METDRPLAQRLSRRVTIADQHFTTALVGFCYGKSAQFGDDKRKIFRFLKESDGGDASCSSGETIRSVIKRNTAYRQHWNRYGTTSFHESLEPLWSSEWRFRRRRKHRTEENVICATSLRVGSGLNRVARHSD